MDAVVEPAEPEATRGVTRLQILLAGGADWLVVTAKVILSMWRMA